MSVCFFLPVGVFFVLVEKVSGRRVVFCVFKFLEGVGDVLVGRVYFWKIVVLSFFLSLYHYRVCYLSYVCRFLYSFCLFLVVGLYIGSVVVIVLRRV